MTAFDSLDALESLTREAVVDLLMRLADDELVIGHRNSEWTGLAPILEEDVAFSSMAQDEMGHARAYYDMLLELGEADPDTIAFARRPREYRCSSLVCLPNNRDWAFCVLRQFLYDAAESVRLAAYSQSMLTPFAKLACKLRGEEKYHLMHGRSWVLRLGTANEDAHGRLQAALDFAYPHALGMFEPTEADEVLAQAEISPREQEFQTHWESAVAPVLVDAGLVLPGPVQPVYGGRVGRHPEALASLLHDMQLVYDLDPSAKW